MKSRIENTFSRAAESTRERVESVVDLTQNRVERAGELVESGSKPVRKLSAASLALTDISHKTAQKLLKQQAGYIEAGLQAAAARLKAAAHAQSVRELIATQRGYLPAAANRAYSNARDAYGIVADAAQDVRALAGNTVSELRETAKPAAKTASRKKSSRTTKTTTTKKTAAKQAA